jgi:hypothetical protein
MKTQLIKALSILYLLIIILSGCQKDENNTLSSQDKILLSELKTSYENARTYNDSMIVIDKVISPDAYTFCDSAYHKNVNLFDSLHNQYHHNHGHDDHYNNGTGMHMMSNMMGMHHDDRTDGHHRAEHDMMDEMTTDHNSRFH